MLIGEIIQKMIPRSNNQFISFSYRSRRIGSDWRQPVVTKSESSKVKLEKRHRDFHFGSCTRLALQAKLSADALCPLADSDQADVAAHSGKCVFGLKAATVVDYL